MRSGYALREETCSLTAQGNVQAPILKTSALVGPRDISSTHFEVPVALKLWTHLILQQ